MDRYDIVFVGNLGTGEIAPFEGTPFIERGSPVIMASIAAARLGKKCAVVTKATEKTEYLLDPVRDAGADLFVSPGEIGEMRILFPTPNVDERKSFVIRVAESMRMEDVPNFEPSLLHMCCMGAPEFQLDLLRGFKARGFSLSVDIQGFVLQPDPAGTVHMMDVTAKEEILRMTDFIKLDALEARALTGAESISDQAEILEQWGGSEIIITCSEGVLARSDGVARFEKFTNRNARGRMGRGDTVIASYLVRRFDHSIDDSLRFAAALTSIKLECAGPFKGSMGDVIDRMNGIFSD